MNDRLRVLFTAWPFPGHLFPQIAVAHALRRRGHDIAFYTGASSAPVVEAEGFRCFRFARLDEEDVDRLLRSRPAEPWRVSCVPRMAAMLQKWLLDTVPDQVADLDQIVREWRPSVIATDPTLWAPMLVTGEIHDVPVAVCSFVPAYMPAGRGIPPFGPGLARHARLGGTLAAAAVRAVTALGGLVSLARVNALRRSCGLPRLDVPVTEHTAAMPLYLVPSAREFDYDRRDLPPSVHYVGPMLWNRPGTEGAAEWSPESIPRDRPCVHVSEGTVHVHQPFLLRSAVVGLASMPVTVIATTGGRPARELKLGAPPPNVQVARWISHERLLPHVDAVVTTGGAGSVLAALAHGVPLVIVPTEWDKPEIAQRVVEYGAGIRLAPQRCTPERLRECVKAVLDRPEYRDAARRLARVFAGLGGADRAAELIAGLERRRVREQSHALPARAAALQGRK